MHRSEERESLAEEETFSPDSSPTNNHFSPWGQSFHVNFQGLYIKAVTTTPRPTEVINVQMFLHLIHQRKSVTMDEGSARAPTFGFISLLQK